MYDAIVLAGGTARRLGGIDKPALRVGDRTLLDRVVAAVADAGTTVVVGPRRPVIRPVVWCREEPPGGGPVAGLAAGLPHTSAGIVLVLAADLPEVAPAVPVLVGAAGAAGIDVALLEDTGGRANLLAAAWRRPALVDGLARLGDPAGAAMRDLVGSASSARVRDAMGWGHDCDTWDDVAAIRAREETP